jgi:hypothetical protein
VASGELADHRGREHHEPTVLAHEVVAVAVALVRVALGVRGAHDDLEPGLGPEGEDLGRVDLGAPGLDVDEIASGQHVDPAQAGFRRQRGDVGDARRDAAVHGPGLSCRAG